MPRYSGIVQSVERRTVNGAKGFPPHYSLSEKNALKYATITDKKSYCITLKLYLTPSCYK